MVSTSFFNKYNLKGYVKYCAPEVYTSLIRMADLSLSSLVKVFILGMNGKNK
jgi:hypothetical protein